MLCLVNHTSLALILHHLTLDPLNPTLQLIQCTQDPLNPTLQLTQYTQDPLKPIILLQIQYTMDPLKCTHLQEKVLHCMSFINCCYNVVIFISLKIKVTDLVTVKPDLEANFCTMRKSLNPILYLKVHLAFLWEVYEPLVSLVTL